jgi:hypothetical protein
MLFVGDLGAADEPRPPELADKTLVTWVQLADLTQRGGSTLTIIDPAERFDAIVFGERHTGRWMAGSDFFRRTSGDQADWPAETATPDTLVQVAIVYRGRHITIYRNAREYASYEIKDQPFGADAMVLIGLRYVGGMGEIGFFKGAIDDARIYDSALSAEQLAALKPNQSSDPRPLAWWDFSDKQGQDQMGRFPAGRLMGEARIADGKLVLDGDGYLWAAQDAKSLTLESEKEDSFDRTVQTMFYKARSRRTGELWDTWLFIDKDTWYLFALAKAGPKWNNISMATSPDGVYWTEHGRILEKKRGVTWMGTGSTWKSPDFARDGKFYLNFSEWRGPRQTIFFAESQDLLHWTRLGDEFEFVQDERCYEPNGRWDCIWTVPKPDGSGLYGYWTATPKKETGGRFGFGQTTDGVRWEALPPPEVHGVGGGEVGAITKIGDRYYMMFGHYPTMRTLIADRPEGPFHAAVKNLVLLDKHTYFSRFLPSPDGLLVNHHCMSRNRGIFFAPLKSAIVDEEGTLRLGWWRGNEKLKHRAIDVQVPDTSAAITMLRNTFRVADGLIIEGTMNLPGQDQDRRGLYVECTGGIDAAILLDSAGKAEIGTMQPDGAGFKAEEKVDREMSFGPTAKFRLLAKHSLIEFYLDDVLIECYSLPQDATGRIGVIGGVGAFGDLRAWSATPESER